MIISSRLRPLGVTPAVVNQVKNLKLQGMSANVAWRAFAETMECPGALKRHIKSRGCLTQEFYTLVKIEPALLKARTTRQ